MSSHAAPRVVFDTNIVISALVFAGGRLDWLRQHWRERGSIPLASQTTIDELKSVLAYSKFRLTAEAQFELLADYMPYCDILTPAEPCPTRCRDPKDQVLLNLAHGGYADILVTGDQDLLVLSGQTRFAIETPETYRIRAIAAK